MNKLIIAVTLIIAINAALAWNSEQCFSKCQQLSESCGQVCDESAKKLGKCYENCYDKNADITGINSNPACFTNCLSQQNQQFLEVHYCFQNCEQERVHRTELEKLK